MCGSQSSSKSERLATSEPTFDQKIKCKIFPPRNPRVDLVGLWYFSYFWFQFALTIQIITSENWIGLINLGFIFPSHLVSQIWGSAWGAGGPLPRGSLILTPHWSSEHARFRYKFCILVYCHTLIHAVKINENAVFGPNPGHFALPKSVSNGHESLSNDYYDAYIFVSGLKVNPYSVHGSVEWTL